MYKADRAQNGEVGTGMFSSVTQSCLTLCDPTDCSTPGFPVHHQLLELAQTHVHQSVMPSNHLILCHPLLLLSSIFPSIRVFSDESVLHIRWPEYWGFSYSICPSNEYSGLISFRIDSFDFLTVQGLSRVFSNTTVQSEEELKSLLMKVKEESEIAGLKLNIQKTKIIPSGPITSWQIDVETVSDFIFLGSKITPDGDCSHEIKRRLLLGRKAMTNLDNMLKSRDITLLTKVHIVRAMVFPLVMYGCESWTIKKAECWRINTFELWCWRRPWTARVLGRYKEAHPPGVKQEKRIKGTGLA